VSNRVSRRQGGRWAAQAQQPADDEAPQDEPQAPAQDSMSDKLAQLKELGELKSQGVLTEAEFQAQKQRILG
jgi:hypothetical protein